MDTFERAKVRTAELVQQFQRPQIAIENGPELTKIVEAVGAAAGMEHLPGLT